MYRLSKMLLRMFFTTCLQRLRPAICTALLYAASTFPVLAQKTVFVPAAPDVTVVHYQPTPDFSAKQLVREIHRRANEVRRQRGLVSLELDSRIETIAQAHSRDMGERGYFDHINLAGRNVTQRARAADYVCVPDLQNPVPVGMGENLYAGFRYSSYRLRYYPEEIVAEFEWRDEPAFAREAILAWLESDSHRRNLLHPDYRLHGIGVYVTRSMEIFVTHNFC